MQSTRRTRAARAPFSLREWLDSPPSPETLSAIFEAEVRPKLSSRRTANRMAAAVHQFNIFLGRHAEISDVMPQRLADFRDSILTSGRSDSIGLEYERSLRRVARFTADRAKSAAPPAGSLRQFFEETFLVQRMIGASATHLRDMRQTLRKLNAFHGGDVTFAELSDRLAADFFAWLLARGLKPVTVNGHRARLYSIWRMAVDLRLVGSGPKVRKLRESSDSPDTWDEAAIARLLAAPLAVKWPRAIAGMDAGKWWRALLLLAYWTSLRRGTLLKLCWSDLDLTAGWLTVPGTRMKHRRGQRFRLPPDAVDALQAIAEPDRDLVFPHPFTYGKFYKDFHRIRVQAGLPKGTRSMSCLHKLRRSVATIVATRAGLARAAEFLGHSTTAMTRRYVDPIRSGHDPSKFLPVPAAPTSPAMVDVAITAGNGEGRSTVTELDVASHLNGDGGAPDPHQLLRDAARLLAAGDGLFAAAGCRMALERWLSDFGQAVDCTPGRGQPRGVTARARLLRDAELLPHRDFAEIRRVNKSANRAAHGCRVGPERVAEMLTTLERLFRAKFPAAVCA